MNFEDFGSVFLVFGERMHVNVSQFCFRLSNFWISYELLLVLRYRIEKSWFL